MCSSIMRLAHHEGGTLSCCVHNPTRNALRTAGARTDVLGL